MSDSWQLTVTKYYYSIRYNCIPNKKLTYRRGTARRAMLVNYAMFHEMWELERFQLSNSKTDLQGCSRALAMVPFDRRHMISY